MSFGGFGVKVLTLLRILCKMRLFWVRGVPEDFVRSSAVSRNAESVAQPDHRAHRLLKEFGRGIGGSNSE